VPKNPLEDFAVFILIHPAQYHAAERGERHGRLAYRGTAAPPVGRHDHQLNWLIEEVLRYLT